MKSSTVACSTTRIDLPRPLPLPYRHAVRGYVCTLPLSIEESSRLNLGAVCRTADIVNTQDLPLSTNRNFHFWPGCIQHSETGYLTSLLCNLITQHVMEGPPVPE